MNRPTPTETVKLAAQLTYEFNRVAIPMVVVGGLMLVPPLIVITVIIRWLSQWGDVVALVGGVGLVFASMPTLFVLMALVLGRLIERLDPEMG